mmetsp:Transcript_53629/g.131409  ORF Transcript_53629/g.131409 Transcript_53629/m.131409 type:complete len:196 (+) Transcript_53629:2-589(+)
MVAAAAVRAGALTSLEMPTAARVAVGAAAPLVAACDDSNPCQPSQTCCNTAAGAACCPAADACCCPDEQHCCPQGECQCTGCPGASCACTGCTPSGGMCQMAPAFEVHSELLGKCALCHGAMEVAANSLFNTAACKKGVESAVKLVCKVAGPYAAVCKGVVTAICNACRSVTKNHCTWKTWVHKECYKHHYCSSV